MIYYVAEEICASFVEIYREMFLISYFLLFGHSIENS